jgi:hypothetical protein
MDKTLVSENPKSSQNRSSKRNPIGENRPEHEGIEVVEWIWRFYGGMSQGEGVDRSRGGRGEEHGWGGKKKKKKGWLTSV